MYRIFTFSLGTTSIQIFNELQHPWVRQVTWRWSAQHFVLLGDETKMTKGQIKKKGQHLFIQIGLLNAELCNKILYFTIPICYLMKHLHRSCNAASTFYGLDLIGLNDAAWNVSVAGGQAAVGIIIGEC